MKKNTAKELVLTKIICYVWIGMQEKNLSGKLAEKTVS